MANVQTSQNSVGMSYPAIVHGDVMASRRLPSTMNNNRTVCSVRAHWLASFFPDELVIQQKMISIIHNDLFFLVSHVETMLVKDIGRVVYVKTPIFSGLRIIGKNTQHELHIKGLKNSTAAEAKAIIEALLLEDANGVVDGPYWIESPEREDRLANASRYHKNPENY